MNTTIDSTFTGWMFRAYLDLGPVPPRGPHHLWGLDFGIRALMEEAPYPRIQSGLNPSFRAALLAQTGLTPYAVARPNALPVSLRTDRWDHLCARCDTFADLRPELQVRLAWLLGKLCFQSYLLDLVPPGVVDGVSSSPELASLAYLRAYARYRMNLDDATLDYSLAEFEHVARHAPPGIARVDASYQMTVQHVKHHGDAPAVEYWQAEHRKAIDESRSELDEFTHLLVMSRYHRVGGFVPQMRRDKEGVVREMDLAEKFARALPRADEVQALAADEMLYPVLESRTKEATWIGDLELAGERARQTVELSPYDARAWLHLGQALLDQEKIEDALRAYLTSARLAPPGREIAMFMAGQCLEAIDDREAACDAYLESLRVDPLGLSAAERLGQVSTELGNMSIAAWATAQFETLRRHRPRVPGPRPEPYKHLPPPTAASEAG